MSEQESSPSPQKGRIRDARGRRVTQIDPVVMHYLHRHDVIPSGPLGEIAREIGSGWAIQGQFLFTGIWSLALICMAIAHFAKWGGGLSVHPRELRLWLILLTILAFNLTVVWYVSRWIRRKKIRRVLISHRRCPHCGYDLRNLPFDGTDGTTVCPECGCAWRLDEDAGPASAGTGSS
ncbi:MAG: hypothetical protein JSV91_06700 [Phycisphaerales bacterium]|nr:MAG: hypothetical protein JSV91_06700 [Phycisphaerales bacterium]